MWRCVAPALAAGLASAAAQRCGRGVALDAGDSKAPWRQRVAGAQVTSRLRPAPGGVAQAPRLRLLTALEAARQGPCARVPRRAWAARACTDARLLRAPVVPACARPGGRRAHRGGAGSEPCSGALRLGNSGSRTPCCFELRCVMMCLRPDLYWGRQAWGDRPNLGWVWPKLSRVPPHFGLLREYGRIGPSLRCVFDQSQARIWAEWVGPNLGPGRPNSGRVRPNLGVAPIQAGSTGFSQASAGRGEFSVGSGNIAARPDHILGCVRRRFVDLLLLVGVCSLAALSGECSCRVLRPMWARARRHRRDTLCCGDHIFSERRG